MSRTLTIWKLRFSKIKDEVDEDVAKIIQKLSAIEEVENLTGKHSMNFQSRQLVFPRLESSCPKQQEFQRREEIALLDFPTRRVLLEASLSSRERSLIVRIG